jgi:hypothetical protein
MTRYTPQWLQQGSYPASVDRRLIGALWPSPASSGLAVTVASGMTVNIAPGQVAVPSSNNTGTMLCSSDAVEQPPALSAAPASPNNRIDLIICQVRGNDLDAGANNDFLFTTVTGVAATTPVAPAVPANAVALAQIYVPGNSASIVAGNITDRRPFFLSPGFFGLPPQLTAGTPIQSFTDYAGEVWVAKGGINNGQWRKARDVLKARVFRAGAYNFPTGGVPIPYDTIERDVYGLFNLASSKFTAPVAGWYSLGAKLAVGFNTGGNSVTQSYSINGAFYIFAGGVTAPIAGGMHSVNAPQSVYLNANDQLSSDAFSSPVLPAIVGQNQTYCTFEYTGAG